MSDTVPQQLISQLSSLKSSQHLYQSKLTQITTTRQQISEQLEQLQITYDRKIKVLEQRLQSFQQENQQLIKQNMLFKNQIGHFQSRLLEKQKIIALLLQQKKENILYSGSDRSKSDQNESAKASEQGFKKQRNVLGQRQQETNLNFWGKKKQVNNQSKDNHTNNMEVFVAKQIQHPKVVSPPPPPKKIKVQSQSPVVVKQQSPKHVQTPAEVFSNIQQQSSQLQQQVEQKEQKPIVFKPPPPKPAKKSQKSHPKPKKAVRPVQQPQQQTAQHENNSQLLMNYFSNQEPTQLQQNTRKISQIKDGQQPQQEQIAQQPLPQAYNPAQQNYQRVEQANIQEEYHYQRQQVSVSKQFATEKKSRYQAQTQQNNFLEHFNQKNVENQEEENNHHHVAPPPPKKKKKTTGRSHIQQADSYPTQQAFQPQPSFNSNDFFQNLGKSEPEPTHNLDINQSSIDHIDRDSSVISNQQQYFNQEPSNYEQMKRPKPMKMPKKKGKRDNIKMVDSSMFD